MRVILDANILISYLLVSRHASPIQALVARCLVSPVQLVLPKELIQEVAVAHARKPYLASRVSTDQLQLFLESLQVVAETPEPLAGFARYTSDIGDDYLIAYGLVYAVDYLVTGDHALLKLKQIQTLRIVDAVEFAHILGPI